MHREGNQKQVVLKMVQEGKTEQLRGQRCQRRDAQRSGQELGVDWWEGKGTERNSGMRMRAAEKIDVVCTKFSTEEREHQLSILGNSFTS